MFVHNEKLSNIKPLLALRDECQSLDAPVYETLLLLQFIKLQSTVFIE